MKKGFTLLEMIVVMTVVAVLFLLTIPNVSNTVKVVADKGCEVQLKVVDAALVQFLLDKDVQSATIQDLVGADYITQRQTQCHDGRGIRIENGHAQISP